MMLHYEADLLSFYENQYALSTAAALAYTPHYGHNVPHSAASVPVPAPALFLCLYPAPSGLLLATSSKQIKAQPPVLAIALNYNQAYNWLKIKVACRASRQSSRGWSESGAAVAS